MNFLAGGGTGQTPLDPDEAEGLIPSWISTQEDLNRAEQENILRAEAWARGRTYRPEVLLTERFIKQLHRRMFSEVWRWAGNYRTTNKNIGVDFWLIVEELAKLFGDSLYWIENEVYERDELAVRFHHRLVAIHPFSNGNGRVSRSAADLLVESLRGERFTWGVSLASDAAAARRRYIEALQAADRSEIAPLLVFARA
jgi:Fic-DOC domain mobile mystery protein B